MEDYLTIGDIKESLENLLNNEAVIALYKIYPYSFVISAKFEPVTEMDEFWVLRRKYDSGSTEKESGEG